MKTTINVLSSIELINRMNALFADGEDLELMLNNTETLYRSTMHRLDLENLQGTDQDEYIEERFTDLIEAVTKGCTDYEPSVLPALVDYYGLEYAIDLMCNDNIVLHYDCYDMESVARNYIDQCGDETILYHMRDGSYVDEDSLLRDLYFGGDIQEYYYQTVRENALQDGSEDDQAEKLASDYEITSEDEQNYLEMVLECASAEFLANYFDYEKFGRDMGFDGTYIECDNGMIEVTA